MHSASILAWFIAGCGMGGLAGWVCALLSEQRWWRTVRRRLLADRRASRALAAREGSAPASAPLWS